MVISQTLLDPKALLQGRLDFHKALTFGVGGALDATISSIKSEFIKNDQAIKRLLR